MGITGSKKEFTNFDRESNYTILLLGQTGSGKTSLLNLIANFGGVLRLLFDKEQILTHEELARFGQARVSDSTLENAVDDPMASKTSDAKVYQITLASNWHFTIIDTPGFGDSRGVEEDKKHVERIMACLQKVTTINSVMLVMNGRDSRMTATMNYVIAQLTAVMPKAVLDNIVVVFTNTEKKSKLNFDRTCLKQVLQKDPEFQCIDNPFGQVKSSITKDDIPDEEEREDLTKEIRKALKTMEDLGWKLHDLKPVPSKRFAELNEKRERIEALLANNLEQMAEHDRLMSDLQQHQEEIRTKGVVVPLTREVRRWQLVLGHFDSPHYVCRRKECHCNCEPAKVIAPLASLWCFFHKQHECRKCGHSYEDHAVTRAGWKSELVIENVDLGDDKDEATKRLEARIQAASQEKCRLAQQLDQALDEYASLGLRDAYVHLLRSQIAVVTERMAANPDDATLRSFQNTLEQNLAEVQNASDATCCICYENLANTELNCGHKQFCYECSSGLGTCPLCREIVTARKLMSPTVSTAASSSSSRCLSCGPEAAGQTG
ncbi:105313388 [Symbiodinium natans]|uniref:105313388 protein n=1 Tax=Symbiodinium natans TaxID=878477 RepID=A0A812QEN2_9DINO|nr:105313388 [Symbiodinium natans]